MKNGAYVLNPLSAESGQAQYASNRSEEQERSAYALAFSDTACPLRVQR